MTPDQLSRAEDLFFRIRSLPSQEQVAQLNAETDPLIRKEVTALLGPVPADFLGTPIFGTDVLQSLAGNTEPDPMVGGAIGPYRIEKLLGAGGMGAVYLATRADGAFEHKVAIKVVRRGMDTDEILRRFHFERRTLAQLKHPNIAVLHDGGSLPDGRPYLVMEFVDGIPLTHYCREKSLSTVERLRLFSLVCAAVQFAHQNLVIHRDLKPGNILVTADGTPKLLDFGIAKVFAPGTESATITGKEEQRLTPEYASPEQVEGRPVTTTSDIYSLGVILYEMLAGRTPYQFKTRTAAEIQRVRKTSPQRPSTVAGDTAPGNDGTARLRRELRGDLDTIVLMAMRNEPERRYASAEQLAADIDRYMRGLPVIARRDTLWYRTGKFLKRRALASSLAGLILLATGAGVAAVMWQAGVAARQRDEAFVARDQQEAVALFLHDVLASADPFGAGAKATVRQVLDAASDRIDGELRDQPLVQANIRSTIGMAYLGLGENDRAEKHIRSAYEQRLTLLGPEHHDVAESKVDLAALFYARQKFDEAEPLLREALATFKSLRGGHNLDVARVLSELGVILLAKGRVDEAAETLRSAIDIRERESNQGSLALAENLSNLASVNRAQQHFDQAEALMARCLDMYRSLLPETHPNIALSTSKLAAMVQMRGDLDRAEPLYRRAIELELLTLGKDHPEYATTLSSFGSLHLSRGNAKEAELVLREALRVRRSLFPASDPRVVRTQLLLADTFAALNQPDEAAAEFARALEVARSGSLDADSFSRVCQRAAAFHEKRGELDRAQEIRSLMPPTFK